MNEIDAPPVVEPEPAPIVARTFAPLDYFKLKSALLEIAVQEAQLREQAVALHQRKVALFAEAGIPIGGYAFDDKTFSINHV